MKRIQCKFFVLFASCILIYISIGAFSYHCVKKQMDAQYNEALQKVKDGAYLEAKNIFSQLENYKDSVEQVKHIDELIEYDAILVKNWVPLKTVKNLRKVLLNCLKQIKSMRRQRPFSKTEHILTHLIYFKKSMIIRTAQIYPRNVK